MQQDMVIDKEMQRFRSSVPSNVLSPEELEKAGKLEVIRLCQKRCYSEELVTLRKDGVVKRTQLYRLNTVLESDIVRVGGRQCNDA
ncbi:hypothetical protein QQF64_018604 [Cirrhinus molitorella]|uniref:Uncharacterized protein n=1 Tax=Cirrhinus molitorella TaxID=172907 RepID=A0ABR3LDD6_9TELE